MNSHVAEVDLVGDACGDGCVESLLFRDGRVYVEICDGGCLGLAVG